MFHSVHIEGYRSLERLEMHDLGRVNLLVGRNNHGKTSVLEAIYLLATDQAARALWRICTRRGEQRIPFDRPDSLAGEAMVGHSFTGHRLSIGRMVSVSGGNDRGANVLTLTVEEPTASRVDVGPSDEAVVDDEDGAGLMDLRITGSGDRGSILVPLSAGGGMSLAAIDRANRAATRNAPDHPTNVHYVSTSSFDGAGLRRAWDRIQLTPVEDVVLRAVRIVDDRVEQIRAVGGSGDRSTRSGFIVRQRDESFPIPLGSMGDGARRTLLMAIAMANCAGGTLLIDEIDTGLHHTVMSDLWRLILETAEQLDVQVFATSHSLDCVHSLSAICRSENASSNQVSIQRLEKGRERAVPFSEEEIRIVAEQRMEIR